MFNFINTIITDSSIEDRFFYGPYFELMEKSEISLLKYINDISCSLKEKYGRNIVEYTKARIKSKESMSNKLQAKGLKPNAENALNAVSDAVGVRIVCNFIEDIYIIIKEIHELEHIEIIKEKDYISNPKESGYTSYHIIVKTEDDIFAEIQIRTMAMDCWATLEHQLKYKRQGDDSQQIAEELKNCSKEIQAVDRKLEKIKEMIYA